MPIILQEAFDTRTCGYLSFMKRYHGSILHTLNMFQAGMGIVGPASLTKQSRWCTVNITNDIGKTIEIVISLESLWLYGYRCEPLDDKNNPWRLITGDDPDDDFSSLTEQHKSLYFDGKYPNDLRHLNVSRCALNNAVTVLEKYAKTLNENGRPKVDPISAQRCFIVLVLYFAEALRILPIRDLLQKGFESYTSPITVSSYNLLLARNWDTMSHAFLSKSYSKLSTKLGVHDETKLREILWLVYNNETSLDKLDNVRPDNGLGDPGNGGDAGAREGNNDTGGHSGDGGPNRSGAEPGGSKKHARGGKRRDRVAGSGSRRSAIERCDNELYNEDCGPGSSGPISHTSGMGPVGHVVGGSE